MSAPMKSPQSETRESKFPAVVKPRLKDKRQAFVAQDVTALVV